MPGRVWLAGLALLVSAGCGVHCWWDNLTSRDLPWQERLWPSNPDPLEVIRTSSDGAKRAKAFAALREPNDPVLRQKHLALLRETALHDAEPICRLGAIRALGRCKDPEAVRILEDTYKGKHWFKREEFNAQIRQQALAALIETGHAEARYQLIAAAKQPRSEGPATERQNVLDERLTALGGLAKFKQWDAVEALVYVLEEEKDVALRNVACESLQNITGKNLPPDAKVWKETLNAPNALAGSGSFLDRFLTRTPINATPAGPPMGTGGSVIRTSTGQNR